jgi:hypothetical protein
MRSNVAAVLQGCGALCGALAGFTVDVTVGLAVTAVALVVFGLAVERDR